MLARPLSRALPFLAGAMLLAGCCKVDAASSRRQVDEKLAELDAQAARATPATRARIAVERDAWKRELDAIDASDAGNDARSKLKARVHSGVVKWDEAIDDELRRAALPLLVAGKWIGDFWRRGETRFAVRVKITADGKFSHTRNVSVGGKVELRTYSGAVLRVQGATLTYKGAGSWNTETRWTADAPPRPLPTALGFKWGDDPYLLVAE